VHNPVTDGDIEVPLLVVILKCHGNKVTSVCSSFSFFMVHFVCCYILHLSSVLCRYTSFKTHTNRLCSLSVEQVKGSEEMKEKIIAASKDARSLPDYPQELLPDYFTNSVTICDKYLNNYQESHLQTNGTVFTLSSQGTNTLIIWRCVF